MAYPRFTVRDGFKLGCEQEAGAMKNGERPKTDRELRRYLADMRKFAKETASSKEKSLQFLVDAGIATPAGNLRSVYK